MTYPFRFLGGVNSSSSVPPVTSSSNETTSLATPENMDSDFVVILAALLCALICVLGLVAVARCAWLRHFSLSGSSSSSQANSSAQQQQQQQRNRQANKGLKKKVLRSLPTHTYSAQVSARFSAECPICLTEFAEGDKLRVLSQCGHGFHVSCIDTWLGSHSSCPSCRQILVVTRCQNCGGLPSSSSCEEEARRKERQERANGFLP